MTFLDGNEKLRRDVWQPRNEIVEGWAPVWLMRPAVHHELVRLRGAGVRAIESFALRVNGVKNLKVSYCKKVTLKVTVSYEGIYCDNLVPDDTVHIMDCFVARTIKVLYWLLSPNTPYSKDRNIGIDSENRALSYNSLGLPSP